MDGATSMLPTAFDTQGWATEWFEQFLADSSCDDSGAEMSASYSEYSKAPFDFMLQDGSVDDRIPEDIDMREGYGRRVTQDFGFPGARIKPVSTTARNSIRPLEDSGSRPMASMAVPRPSDRPHEVKGILKPAASPGHRRAQNRAMTDSSATGPFCYFTDTPSPCTNVPERRRSESLSALSAAAAPRDEEDVARDMRQLLVTMLEGHAQTLHQVITSIKDKQPTLKELESISSDLVASTRPSPKRKHSRHRHHHSRHPCSCCSAGQAYEQIRHTFYRPIEGHARSRSHSRSRAQSRSCKLRLSNEEDYSTALCSYARPKAAEKLNVGEPGRLDLNLNDRKATLREGTKSLSELIRLVNSAADDLGVDLNAKPSKVDDEKFEAAPVEPEPSPQRDLPTRDVEGGSGRRDGDRKSLCGEPEAGAGFQQPRVSNTRSTPLRRNIGVLIGLGAQHLFRQVTFTPVDDTSATSATLGPAYFIHSCE